MLRACVIGMGPIGNRHAKIYREDDLAELVGVCDIRKDRAAIQLAIADTPMDRVSTDAQQARNRALTRAWIQVVRV